MEYIQQNACFRTFFSLKPLKGKMYLWYLSDYRIDESLLIYRSWYKVGAHINHEILFSLRRNTEEIITMSFAGRQLCINHKNMFKKKHLNTYCG